MALGQSMFSIAVGTGALLAYGAYLPKTVSIPRAAWTIGLADTAAALLAGLVIFPIVFASGLDAGEGPGLIFVTLPVAFSEFPGARVVGPTPLPTRIGEDSLTFIECLWIGCGIRKD